MWLAKIVGILVINTLTRLTIVHGDRGTPALKDEERLQNGLVRDLKIRVLNSVGENCRQSLYRFRTAQIPHFTTIYFIETKIHVSTSR